VTAVHLRSLREPATAVHYRVNDNTVDSRHVSAVILDRCSPNRSWDGRVHSVATPTRKTRVRTKHPTNRGLSNTVYTAENPSTTRAVVGILSVIAEFHGTRNGRALATLIHLKVLSAPTTAMLQFAILLGSLREPATTIHNGVNGDVVVTRNVQALVIDLEFANACRNDLQNRKATTAGHTCIGTDDTNSWL
jgi:hypothetical protein